MTGGLANRIPERWILAVLAVTLLVRVVLVWNGGQGFWPDETRYQASQEAVRRLAEGNVRSALGSAVAQGDHPGFKLLGIVPAAAAKVIGVQDLRLPAAFFTAFSWMALWLLWGIVRRMGASPAAQAWTVAVAGLSTSLTYYTRHLLPYDVSLTLALAAIYVAWRTPGSGWRAFAAGALAGASFLVYLGYWLVAGIALVLIGCGPAGTWCRLLARWTQAAAGFAAALLAVWLIDRLGEGTMVENSRRFSGSITQGDFGSGWWLVWEYFWKAEGWLAVMWLLAVGGLAAAAWRQWRAGERPERTWLLGLGAVAAVYAGLVVLSDLVPKFVVYGRTARQLVPFLSVVTGLALAHFLAGRSRLAWVLGLALAGNFAWQIAPAITVGFPNEFRRKAAAVQAKAPATVPGRSYHRLVNVDHYVYEAERLPYAPEAVLLAARHPYEFEPFLYEGSSARQREQRRAADHRMQLVRMAVPPAMQPVGDAPGQVRMRLRFAPGRAGMSEPVLSLGRRDDGDLFFVRYQSEHHLVLGMESVGSSVQTGPPVPYEPGREYELDLFSGSMLPPDAAGLSELQKLYYANLVRVSLDGVEVLRAMAVPHRVDPAETYAGYNRVEASSAVTAFSGEILAVRRGGLPEMDGAAAPGRGDYGAIRLHILLPAAAAGIPEPLVVAGVPGSATFVYVRVMSEARIKLGVEIWGIGAWESEPVSTTPGQPVDLVVSCPAFFPAPGAATWGGATAAQQQEVRSRLQARVNGAIVLDVPAPAIEARSEPVFYGKNPLGGSLVSEAFTGRLLQVSRLPLATP